MNITRQPAGICLAENLPPLELTSVADVFFELRVADSRSVPVLSHVYTPDDSGRVSIDLRRVVAEYLSTTFFHETDGMATAWRQPELVRPFYFTLDSDGDSTDGSFIAAGAGVANFDGDAATFLHSHFLTWQPQVKAVAYYQPEYLTYVGDLTLGPSVVIKGFDKNGTDIGTEVVDFSHISDEPWNGSPWMAATFDVTFATVSRLIGDDNLAYYQVYAIDGNGTRLTPIHYYHAQAVAPEWQQWFLFRNSLGGIDTFQANGHHTVKASHTHNTAEIDSEAEEYRVDTHRDVVQAVGPLDLLERRWMLDFFPSLRKFVVDQGVVRRIVVTDSDAQYDTELTPVVFTFTYRLADTRALLNIPTTDAPPELPELTTPAGESFTVAPRLVDCVRTLPAEGALIPMQQPHTEQWQATTIGALLEALRSRLFATSEAGGAGHGHSNYELLERLMLADGYLTLLGQALKVGHADEASRLTDLTEIAARFLSRTGDDTAAGLITFLAGLRFGTGGTGQLLSNGDARLREIVADALEGSSYTGSDLATDRGFRIYQDSEGRGHVITDYLEARVKAVFQALEVRKAYFTGGNLYVSGAGAKISLVRPVDIYGQVWQLAPSDGTLRQATPLVVGGRMVKTAGRYLSRMTASSAPQVMTRTLHTLALVGGKSINNGGLRLWKSQTIARGTDTAGSIYFFNSPDSPNKVLAWRCYFPASDGERAVENEWRVGDQALSQTMNLLEGYHEGVRNRRYWRLVVRTGSEVLSDGKLYHYVDLANFGPYMTASGAEGMGAGWLYGDGALPDGTYTGAMGLAYAGIQWLNYNNVDIPLEGDELVQCGSQIDSDRQGLIQLAAVGSVPQIGIYYGINDFASLSTHRALIASPSEVVANAGFFKIETTGGGKENVLDESYKGEVTRTLAQFKTTIEDDRRTAIADSKEEIMGDVAADYLSKTDAANTYATQGSVGTLRATVENHAEYIESSTESISRIEQRVNSGKNLLSGVLTGEGWASCQSEDASTTLHLLTISDGTFIIQASGDSYIISPFVLVEEGKDYTLSFYWATGGGYSLAVVASDGTIRDSFHSGSGGTITWTFTAQATERVRLSIGVDRLARPQLELGTVATEFETNGTEISSLVRQTADRIELKVRSELGATGIDITQRELKLIGNKVGFYDSLNGNEYIKIGLQSVQYNGETVQLPYFIFMAPDGVTPMYNLGYTGLRQLVNNAVADSWEGAILMGMVAASKVAAMEAGEQVNPLLVVSPEQYSHYGESGWFVKTGSQDVEANPMGEVAVWLYREGYTVGSNNERIYNLSGTSTPSQYDGRYYYDQATDQQGVPLHPVADSSENETQGWFFKRGNNEDAYHDALFIENGQVKATGSIETYIGVDRQGVVNPQTMAVTYVERNWYKLTMKHSGLTAIGVVNDKGGDSLAGYTNIPASDNGYAGEIVIPDFPTS